MDDPITIQVEMEIDDELANELEESIAMTECANWVIRLARGEVEGDRPLLPVLTGYFTAPGEAREQWERLRVLEPRLPATPRFLPLAPQVWQTSYRQYYRAWQIGKLHLVPEWERESYHLPVDAVALYLDPGMAFGMCDHPTTRLCLMALSGYCERWHPSRGEMTVIDVGCGSGILTLAAAALGAVNPYGFDCDPVAIRVSQENATKNNLHEYVCFECRDIKAVFPGRTADVVLANQLGNLLLESAELLVRAVRPGGMLAISGILPEEVVRIETRYNSLCDIHGKRFTVHLSTQDNWHGITFLCDKL